MIKNIKRMRNKIIKNLENDKFIKNQYDNLKLERKKLLNMLSSMIVNLGFIKNHREMIDSIDNFTKKILNEVYILASMRSKNIDWFEDNDIVEPCDNRINYNYDIY